MGLHGVVVRLSRGFIRRFAVPLHVAFDNGDGTLIRRVHGLDHFVCPFHDPVDVKRRPGQLRAGLLIQLGDGQPVRDILIVENQAEAVRHVVGIDPEFVGGFLHKPAALVVVGHGNGIVKCDSVFKTFVRVEFDHTVGGGHIRHGGEGQGAIGEIGVAVPLDFPPSACAGQVLLLQHEHYGLLLAFRQAVVTGEAYGDVYARGFLIEPHLQRITVVIAPYLVAVFIGHAVAGAVGDQEAVTGVVFLVVGIGAIAVVHHGRLHHFQIIDGILVNGNRAVVQFHGGIAGLCRLTVPGAEGLVFGDKGDFLAVSAPDWLLVGIQQAEFGAVEPCFHTASGIDVKFNGINTVDALLVGAGGGNGYLVTGLIAVGFDRIQPFIDFVVPDPAQLRAV